LGIGQSSKIGLIAIGAFGVVYASTVQGIRGVDRRLVELAQLHEKSRVDLVLYVLLPSAAPTILTGLRVALGLSWILLVAAEMVASKMVSPATRLEGLGLGWLIFDARRFGRPEEMIVGMLAMGVFGKLSDLLMAAIQARVLAWRTAFSGV
jgi:sulfonate transport system permease protein